MSNFFSNYSYAKFIPVFIISTFIVAACAIGLGAYAHAQSNDTIAQLQSQRTELLKKNQSLVITKNEYESKLAKTNAELQLNTTTLDDITTKLNTIVYGSGSSSTAFFQ